MAIIGFLDIGMGVSTAGLSKGFKSAADQVQGFGSRLGSAAKVAAGFGLAAGAGIGASIYKAVTAGSDLSEQINKVNVVFGNAAGTIMGTADELAKAFGIPKTEILEAAGNIGLIAKGAGLSEQAAADLGSDFAKLAADAGSFFNVSTSDALEKIRSGLVGESEPLRAFGVLLNEEAVKAEAARLGLVALGTTLTEGQKVQARASLITKGLATASGDLARTSAGTANQMRNVSGQIQNAFAEIGMAVQPVAQEILGSMTSALSGVTEFVTQNRDAIASWAQGAAQWIGEIIVVFRNWRAVAEIAGVQIGGVFINVGETISWLGDTIGAFLDWFGTNWQKIFNDAFYAVTTALANLGANFIDFGKAAFDWLASGFSRPFQFEMTPIMGGFAATTPAFDAPELNLSSSADQVLAIQDRIANDAIKATEKVAGTAAQAVAGTTAAEATSAKVEEKLIPDEFFKGETIKPASDEYKGSAALQLGSAEARSAILAFRSGASNDPMQLGRQQLSEAQRQTKILDRLEKKLGGDGAELAVQPL